MKKILLLFFPIIFVACCDKYPQQSCFKITKIESVPHDNITSDSVLKIYNNFCHYEVEGNGHQLTITDSVGKFQVGDTIVFGEKIKITVDTIKQ